MTKIALVMIARDEAANLERCLSSAAPFVERMIVLDTGSVDGTPALAAGLGAEVHRFTWIDDFAAARNAALDLSDAEWNLVLDADEWIEQGGETIADVVNGDRRFIGAARILNAMDLNGGLEVSSTWVPRLLPVGVRYAGRIHEQPVSDLPRYRIELQLGHDGYRADALARKKERNLALLLAALDADPEDGYLLFQTGKAHQVYGDFPGAARYLSKALTRVRTDEPFRHPLVVNAIYSLKMAGEIEAALAVVDAEFEAWQTSPDFLFVMGDLYLEHASRNPDEALKEHLPLVEYCWKRCLDVGEQDRLEGSVRGRGGHMAAYNLSVLYGSLGLNDKAEHYAALATQMRSAA